MLVQEGISGLHSGVLKLSLSERLLWLHVSSPQQKSVQDVLHGPKLKGTALQTDMSHSKTRAWCAGTKQQIYRDLHAPSASQFQRKGFLCCRSWAQHSMMIHSTIDLILFNSKTWFFFLNSKKGYLCFTLFSIKLVQILVLQVTDKHSAHIHWVYIYQRKAVLSMLSFTPQVAMQKVSALRVEEIKKTQEHYKRFTALQLSGIQSTYFHHHVGKFSDWDERSLTIPCLKSTLVPE